MRVLQMGSRGEEVGTLQRLLNSYLTPSPRLSPDGIFGTKTRDAVNTFQGRVRLKQDGIVGPQTWRKLGKTEPASTGGRVVLSLRDNDPTAFWKTPYGEATLDDFDIDSAELKPAHEQWLDSELAPFLRKHPQYAIRLEGYTSRTGEAQHNLDLSRRRSESVAKHLVAEGIGLNRMLVAFYGESRSTSELEEDYRERCVVITIRDRIRRPKPKPGKSTPGKPDDGYVPMIPPDLRDKYVEIRNVSLWYKERLRGPDNEVIMTTYPSRVVMRAEALVKRESTATKRITTASRIHVNFNPLRTLLGNWIDTVIATITDFDYGTGPAPPPFDLNSMTGEQIEALWQAAGR